MSRTENSSASRYMLTKDIIIYLFYINLIDFELEVLVERALDLVVRLHFLGQAFACGFTAMRILGLVFIFTDDLALG